MTRWTRLLLCAAGMVGALAGAGVGYVYAAYPKVGPAPALTAARSDEALARGRYLAEHAGACVACHSERDWARFAAPVIPGTEGKGGERFGGESGLPGTFFAKNITPAALAGWSDGEILRAITSGVSKDDSPLFPLMPYLNYGKMCERDVAALVAYLRAMKPIEHAVPKSELGPLMALVARTLPEAARPEPCPSPSDRRAYGAYLATVGGCADCHTPSRNGKPEVGMEYAGGFAFGPLPNGGGVVRASNLTPEVETGIGAWSQQEFVRRFKSFADPKTATPVKAGAFNTVMPWAAYAGMTEEDLGAVYDYLRTLKPVKNAVERWVAP